MAVVCTCSPTVGEVETEGSLGLATKLVSWRFSESFVSKTTVESALGRHPMLISGLNSHIHTHL